jgi:hypothetical protein
MCGQNHFSIAEARADALKQKATKLGLAIYPCYDCDWVSLTVAESISHSVKCVQRLRTEGCLRKNARTGKWEYPNDNEEEDCDCDRIIKRLAYEVPEDTWWSTMRAEQEKNEQEASSSKN